MCRLSNSAAFPEAVADDVPGQIASDEDEPRDTGLILLSGALVVAEIAGQDGHRCGIALLL